MLLESIAEVMVIIVSDHFRDDYHAQIGAQKKAAGILQADRSQIFEKGHPHKLFKLLAQIGVVYSELYGKTLQVQIFIVVRRYIE